MKWTADNDQLLFVKLIETHDVSIRAGKIREAWPKDGREIPTARAISERILKIKNSQKKTSAKGPVPLTPRKRKSPGPVATTPRTTKAQRVVHGDNESESPTTSVEKSGEAAATKPQPVAVKPEPEDTAFSSHESGVFYSFDGSEEQNKR